MTERDERLGRDRPGSTSRYLGTVTGLGFGVTRTAPVRVNTNPTSVIGPVVAGEAAALKVQTQIKVPVEVLDGQVRDGIRLIAHLDQGRWFARRGSPCTTRSIRVNIGDYCGPLPVTIRYQGPGGIDETREVTLVHTQFAIGWIHTDQYLDPAQGTWTITVSAGGRHDRTLTVEYGPNCTESVNVTLCPTTVGGTITVGGCGAVDFGGEPIAGAAVTVHDPDGDLLAAGSTDATGRFTFTSAWPEGKCGLPERFNAPGRIDIVPPGGIGLVPISVPLSFWSNAICNLSRSISFADTTTFGIDPDWVCGCRGRFRRALPATDKYGGFELIGGEGPLPTWRSERMVFDPDGRTVEFVRDGYQCNAVCKDGGAAVVVSYELSCQIGAGPYGGNLWRLTKATTSVCDRIGPVTFYGELDTDCPPAPVPYQTSRSSGVAVFEDSDISPSPWPTLSPLDLIFEFDNTPLNIFGQGIPVDGFDDVVHIQE